MSAFHLWRLWWKRKPLQLDGRMSRKMPRCDRSHLYLVETVSVVAVMVNDIVTGALGLGFNFRAGQIGHCVVNGSPLLQRFFEAVLLRC